MEGRRCSNSLTYSVNISSSCLQAVEKSYKHRRPSASVLYIVKFGCVPRTSSLKNATRANRLMGTSTQHVLRFTGAVLLLGGFYVFSFFSLFTDISRIF